jgi:hypothetical protein
MYHPCGVPPLISTYVERVLLERSGVAADKPAPAEERLRFELASSAAALVSGGPPTGAARYTSQPSTRFKDGSRRLWLERAIAPSAQSRTLSGRSSMGGSSGAFLDQCTAFLDVFAGTAPPDPPFKLSAAAIHIVNPSLEVIVGARPA